MPDYHCKKYWLRPGCGFVSGEYYGLEKKRVVLSGSIGWHVLSGSAGDGAERYEHQSD